MPSFNVYFHSTVQASVFKAVANVAGQYFDSKKYNVPFSLALAPVLAFFVWGLVQTPLWIKWSEILDRHFPPVDLGSLDVNANHKTKGNSNDDLNDNNTEKKESTSIFAQPNKKDDTDEAGVQSEPSENQIPPTNFLNIFISTLLTETILSPITNAIFIAYISFLRGLSYKEIGEVIRLTLPSIEYNSFKIWPIVTFIGLLAFPIEGRVFFRALVGVVWSIYLSW
ncbi:hypothetical protein V1514DRAFT_327243 [Lipomyces japonicus]|uniref:uncharacterized protein n=1 Tax=Lipomyces japonicus TaxID=56871 RepID=UPI0034CF062E